MATKISEIILKEEKDINNSYLVIRNIDLEKEGYEYKILEEEKIDGTLEYRVGSEDGKAILRYDITGAISLDEYLRFNKLKKKDLKYILKSIKRLLSTIEDYLISENSILLDPRSIFLIKENNITNIKFCIVPALLSNFQEELSRLLVRLLRHIDLTDKTALQLAYALFIKSSKKNYSILDLMSVIYEDEKVDTYDEEVEINQAEIEEDVYDIDLYRDKEIKVMNNDFTKFIDDEINIDNDTRKALGMKIIDEIDESPRNIKNDKYIDSNNKKIKKKKEVAFSLSAKIKPTYFICPLLSIVVPILAYVLLGGETFRAHILLLVMYEIIIVLIISLNSMLDNLYSES